MVDLSDIGMCTLVSTKRNARTPHKIALDQLTYHSITPGNNDIIVFGEKYGIYFVKISKWNAEAGKLAMSITDIHRNDIILRFTSEPLKNISPLKKQLHQG